jgi:Leucine-rich repeat (LRR) protein
MKYLKKFEGYWKLKTQLLVPGEQLYNLDNYLPLSNDLKILDCSNNYIKKLPELPDTLTNLSCSNNFLQEFPKLPNGLTELYIKHNEDIKKIYKLPVNLEILNCAYTDIMELPILPKKLKELSCDNNNLEELPELPNELEYLCVGRNKLKKLPELPESLNIISIESNDWDNPIPYKYVKKFQLRLTDMYIKEQIEKFSSFKFQKEFLEREPENFMDLKPLGYADGLDELFPNLFDMDDLGLLD